MSRTHLEELPSYVSPSYVIHNASIWCSTWSRWAFYMSRTHLEELPSYVSPSYVMHNVATSQHYYIYLKTCPLWMCHVTFQWVMSHVNESWVDNVATRQHYYIPADTNQRYQTYIFIWHCNMSTPLHTCRHEPKIPNIYLYKARQDVPAQYSRT